ncbi:MAG: YkgJ family cysteine cluster protein [Deltaproteobacteria bacterium]|nr:YkgJ family cysteine cluster protein [Deltaproteobacteria bacterium]
MSVTDLSVFFEKYETMAENAAMAFQKIRENFPDMVRCRPGCTDCCYALFDLTLIEALYIKRRFDEIFAEEEKTAMLEKANNANRQIYRLKKAAFKAVQDGKDETMVVENMAREKIKCPLLTEQDRCGLYPYRPIACKIYGAPLAIGGKGRTCGMAGFERGKSYPTINMDAIHDQLLRISEELVLAIGSKHDKLSEVLVPLSMALLTEYDAEYLGSANKEKEKGDAKDGES